MLVLSSYSVANQFKPYHLKTQVPSSSSHISSLCFKFPLSYSTKSMYNLFSKRPLYISNTFIRYATINPINQSLDWEDTEDFEDTGSPWEGAIIYKRNPSITHVEYCTTLERLGLGQLSTEISKSRASVMGLRVTKAVKDFPQGTPVQISIDVTRKKQKLRLDGIIRTVLTLGCNRCGEPAAESVFSNLSLLLSEQPIEEPEIIDIGAMFGEDKSNSSIGRNGEEDDDDSSVDLDDRLYFPLEEREIDISKNIRDMVHLEITINAICDPKCKGICLKCGTNMNKGKCNCSPEEAKERSYPLGDLRRQMERNEVV
ncbi:hypothetical protein Ddye_030576 [Dipteronia dyeriana]|uniref:Large ribosomal RNA subunit accumulation protein YceD n=1 Tax=Dipteronia dyeriana TaxID=168575 RepID=A0AAD9TGK3_9ROSI|nr:hypothetical protein Ddye_030576 [Dipteronia dyeriana]